MQNSGMKMQLHLTQVESSGLRAKREIRSLLVLLIATTLGLAPRSGRAPSSKPLCRTELTVTRARFLPPQSHRVFSGHGSLHGSLCLPGMCPPLPAPVPLRDPHCASKDCWRPPLAFHSFLSWLFFPQWPPYLLCTHASYWDSIYCTLVIGLHACPLCHLCLFTPWAQLSTLYTVRPRVRAGDADREAWVSGISNNWVTIKCIVQHQHPLDSEKGHD